MRIWICDDNQASARSLAQLISVYETAEVQIMSSPGELERSLRETTDLPQALFLDIVFAGFQQETSLAAAERIHHLYPHLPIVFVTAYVEYAPRIFEAAPVYMLQKPFERERVAAALRAVRARAAQEAADVLPIRQKGELRQVPLASIEYIESDRRKLLVHADGQVHTCYGKLPALLGELPPYFAQCHQSYAVNLNYVSCLQGETVTLFSGARLPVSRRRRQAFRTAVDLFMAQPTFVADPLGAAGSQEGGEPTRRRI